MAYEPKTWTCGETITADALNHMEQGIAQSGGGGGGAGFFVVKTTDYDSDEGSWSKIDHTFAEITDAIDNGSIPILMVVDGSTIDSVYHFGFANSSRIEFIRTRVDSNNVAMTGYVTIFADNTITTTIYTCPRQ